MDKKNFISGVTWGKGDKKKVLYIPWIRIILCLSIAATVAGVFFSTKTLADVNKNIARTKEEARPANVKLVKITTPDCVDCFDIDSAIGGFKKLNINIEEEKTLVFDSPEAKAVIKQLSVKKVPTFLVTGEVTKNSIETFVKNNGTITDDTFIFTKVLPVYIDTQGKKETGRVTLTMVTDPSCDQCFDPALTVESFKKSGVKVSEQKEVVWNSSEGQRIITQYAITKLPTFIFSSEIDVYDNVKKDWAKFGTIEKDKTYVARNIALPYRDLEKNQITGLVDVVYLTDATCGDCYNVQNVQKPILTKGYGVGLRSERVIDIASVEGKQMINKYNITEVPTMVLSPEIDQYANLKNVWNSVGLIGKDGWYVFTGLKQLGNVVYKNLTDNQIINPPQK